MRAKGTWLPKYRPLEFGGVRSPPLSRPRVGIGAVELPLPLPLPLLCILLPTRGPHDLT